jgi:hypothetical protein
MCQGIFGFIPFFTRMMDEQTLFEKYEPATLRLYYWAGILGNAAIILMWLVTRTVGIPFFGPEAGQTEKVGFVDLVSKATEVAVIVHLWLLLRRTDAPEPVAQAAT